MEKSLKITINGREYDNVEAMSAEDRALYEKMKGLMGDKDGDGSPDIFETFLDGNHSDVPDLKQLLGDIGKGSYSWVETRTTSTIDGQAQASERKTIFTPEPGGAGEATALSARGQDRASSDRGTVVRAGGSGWARTLAMLSLVALAGIAWWLMRG
jgi:hypothetical protein